MRTPGCTPRGVRPGVRRVRAGRTPQAYALLAWAYASGVRPGGWRTPPAAMWGAYARRTPRRTPGLRGVRLGVRLLCVAYASAYALSPGVRPLQQCGGRTRGVRLGVRLLCGVRLASAVAYAWEVANG